MSFTQEQLTALNDAIASGAMSAVYRDRTVQFRTLREMYALKAEMERELGISSGSRSTMRVRYITGGTGL